MLHHINTFLIAILLRFCVIKVGKFHIIVLCQILKFSVVFPVAFILIIEQKQCNVLWKQIRQTNRTDLYIFSYKSLYTLIIYANWTIINNKPKLMYLCSSSKNLMFSEIWHIKLALAPMINSSIRLTIWLSSLKTSFLYVGQSEVSVIIT